MRVVDQIGNAYFNGNTYHVFGLLNDLVAENSEAVFNPDYFFNFPYRRLSQLVTDPNICNDIIAIFKGYKGVVTHEFIFPSLNRQIKVSDFLKEWGRILTENGLTLKNLSYTEKFMHYVQQAVNACSAVK